MKVKFVVEKDQDKDQLKNQEMHEDAYIKKLMKLKFF